MNDIFLAIPSMGEVRTELVNFILHQQWHSVVITNEITPVALARNTLVDRFLETDAKAILFIDSDTVPPPKALEILEDYHDHNTILTGITPIRKGGVFVANVFQNEIDVASPKPIGDLPEQPFEVAGCGASCLYIPRNILEELDYPWFRSIEFEQRNAYCSEDLYFCDLVKGVGAKILAIPELRCKHYKVIGL